MDFDLRVITATEWGARAPNGPSTQTTPKYIVVHHTATNNTSRGTLDGAKLFARQLQSDALDNKGWFDSGHNFLNSTGGFLLEGRQGSWAAAQQGKSVRGAHAGTPLGNESPGIENEGNFMVAKMPQAQWDQLVSLCAYLCRSCRLDPNQIVGHREFVATACPGDWLYSQLPTLRQAVRARLKAFETPPQPTPQPTPDPKPTPTPTPNPTPQPPVLQPKELDVLGKVLLAQVPQQMQSYARLSLPFILASLSKYSVVNPDYVAYVIATAEHESHLGRWMEEIADGSQYEGRSDLGNTQPGDGRRYKGRGFVQLTGRVNYQKYTDFLKLDLVNNPTLASDPRVASEILVNGMLKGTFTGYKLSDFGQASGSYDFVRARKIVNALDRAEQIAQRARAYRSVLTGTAGGDKPQPLPPNTKTVYRLLVPRYDNRTLRQARKLAPDAFERTVDGKAYVQVAAYPDLKTAEQKKAQWLADNFPGAVIEAASVSGS
ncbi:N-acetylmuramoyl-L-alanine amidase [Leptolyngbya sp. FACHB-261]|uniref:N-acetylmuramoyl-L-alanine amidase n=1 Tax=Leptolyngbya sp. FACHB-261 TaxID=2692806 RepID=UPI0016874DBC|nr:N-acetylmuramoyl-L-alanine amidase [Leptolyngbya sp. FACHB-261]MBD2099612.1 N-acetylmuramoyl-L-alanine amidase [Leptolyngbya sp. FACHB-261]